MINHMRRFSFPNFEWVDICNPEENELLEIAHEFQLGIFQVKDSLEMGHLPKIESNAHHHFLLFRAYSANITDRITNINELSNKVAFFYNENQVITIHRASFSFLEKPKQNIASAEQLMLYFVSSMIKTFTEPSIHLSERVDQIEQTIFIKEYKKISLEELYYQKSQTRISKKLLHITQAVLQHWEVKEENRSALQDIKDHIQSLILTYEEVADDSVNLLNTYLSVNAQKTNDVMKLLTIFSVFFLPLTFIVGVYGMNFENIPELKWHYGYFIALGVMLSIIILIFIWFRRKKIL